MYVSILQKNNFVPEMIKTSPRRRRRTNHPKTTSMPTATKSTAAKILTTMTAKTQKTPMTKTTTAKTQMTRKITQIAPKARTTATFKTIPVAPKATIVATILQMKSQTVPKGMLVMRITQQEMEAVVGRIPTTIATMLMTLRRAGTETTLNKESNSKAKAIQAQHIPIYCTSLP